MRRFLCQKFQLLGWNLLTVCFTVCSPLEAAPQRLSTLLYPVEYKESSIRHPLLIGASNIELDLQKQDLELVIWKNNKSFALEVKINVKGVNQSILPTDADGKLLAKVTSLSAVPWIKVYMPEQAPQTLDVSCDSKTQLCRGVWKNFPYDPRFEGVVQIKANIRGLEGKVWSPFMTAFLPTLQTGQRIGLRSATLDPPYALPSKLGKDAARVEVTRHYDLLSFPAEFSKLRLLSVYSWIFKNDSKMRSSGYFRVLRKTLFHIDHGQALVDLLSLNTLQTFEVLQDQSFWTHNKHILAFSSKKLSRQSETHIRLLEFEE